MLQSTDGTCSQPHSHAERPRAHYPNMPTARRAGRSCTNAQRPNRAPCHRNVCAAQTPSPPPKRRGHP
eukprot:11197381-Lingulodinium_polyedra.AAC.1